MSVLSRARTVGLAIVAGAALAVVPTLTASAHVTVSSPDAAAGRSGTLVFRVPTESDTASTTSLTIELPADTPFRSVSVGAMPGWTSSIERTTLDEPVEVGGFTLTEVATSVTWTTDGPGIAPGEFGEFKLRVGPFPAEGGTFAFPATQTYSDGEVVAWADPVPESGDEPDHPAPTLTVAPADGEVGDEHGHGGDATTGTPTDTGADANDDGSDGGGTDTTARVLGVVGIVVGVLGVVIGLVLGRRRNPSGTAGA